MMARVSVVVPSANRKDDLMNTIESILHQTYRDFELLIADDGSTDGTGLDILSNLGPDASRAEQVWRDSLHEETGARSIQMIKNGLLIHYFHQITPRGAAAARNRALASATGEYAAFAEAGDSWHPWKLEQQVQLLDTQRDIPASPYRHATTKGPGKKRASFHPLEFEEALIPPGLVLSGAILRRAVVDWEGPFDENLPSCEEYDFWLRLASRHHLGTIEGNLQDSAPPRAPATWSLDRYRVYSMEKAFQSGHLNSVQRHRIAAALVDRCARLAAGYRQRENLERANFYERKRKRFVAEVTKLELSDPAVPAVRRERKLSGLPA